MIIETGGIFLINKNIELLVAHPTNHAKNFWSIPKGKVEKGEDFFTAALREMHEEVNVNLIGKKLFTHQLTPKVFKNKRKRLNSFVVLEHENPHIDFSIFELKCNSKVKPEIGDFYEMDNFLFLPLNEVGSNNYQPHHTQMECLAEINKIINNIKK
jgi:ADP-ribose pyrophosphatase YjhB (NUDIX family)